MRRAIVISEQRLTVVCEYAYIACCQSVLMHSSNQRVLCGPQTSQGTLTPEAKDAIEAREDLDRQLEDVEELTDEDKLTRGGRGPEGSVGKRLKVGKGRYIGVNNDEEDDVGEVGSATTDEFVEPEPASIANVPVHVAIR